MEEAHHAESVDAGRQLAPASRRGRGRRFHEAVDVRVVGR